MVGYVNISVISFLVVVSLLCLPSEAATMRKIRQVGSGGGTGVSPPALPTLASSVGRKRRQLMQNGGLALDLPPLPILSLGLGKRKRRQTGLVTGLFGTVDGLVPQLGQLLPLGQILSRKK